MNEADRHTCRYNPYAPDVQYRDGLIMALLAARPFRLKNLASVQLGTHLRLIGNTFWLIFKEQEVKNHKYIGHLLCLLGFHDFKIIDKIFGFAFSRKLMLQGGSVETVQCRRCQLIVRR